MKFIDLFAGIGGFRYGLESANRSGLSKQRARTKKRWTSKHDKGTVNGKQEFYTCVWSNEWDKYASQIYKKHYEEIDTKDIRTVKSDEIPNHDLLCAGFPCQAFSIAGKRLGFNDTRGTLFYEIARIAKDKRPRYLLLENVKGLLSHDKGKTFATILGVLANLGYRVEWQVLNSKYFGVPQNRERVFIVGYLGKESGPKVFPIGEDEKEFNKRQSYVSSCLDSHYYKGSSRGFGGKGRQLIRTDEQNTQKRRNKPNSDNAIRRTPYTDGMRIRRLTPTECERLQGFPDGWTEGLSDTQRYKCLGNAVTTNVITAIGRKLKQNNEEKT